MIPFAPLGTETASTLGATNNLSWQSLVDAAMEQQGVDPLGKKKKGFDLASILRGNTAGLGDLLASWYAGGAVGV